MESKIRFSYSSRKFRVFYVNTGLAEDWEGISLKSPFGRTHVVRMISY